MIEREFVAQKTKEFYIRKHIEAKLRNVGISQIKLKKIPLGEKIIIYTSRPSIIVGSKGSNIKQLTKDLRTKFKLENPQIEINEVKDIFLDASIVAERIAGSLERFGSARFKGVGHKIMENVIRAGALGVEVIISGKIPGSRAKSWRFYRGYLKKCGDIAVSGVRKSHKFALLKSGVIGIKVAIMPAGLILPDSIEILDEPEQVIEEITEEPKKKPVKKKTTKKKAKTEEKVVAEPIVAPAEALVAEESKSVEAPAKEEKKEEPTKEAIPEPVTEESKSEKIPTEEKVTSEAVAPEAPVAEEPAESTEDKS
jgi:small subunit ribosomal protein S3